MSYINDYSIRTIANQRQRDLWAAADGYRLAAAARGNRPGWWHRLFATLRHSTQPDTARPSISPSLAGVTSVEGGSQTAVAR
jgi:hypothetical protein